MKNSFNKLLTILDEDLNKDNVSDCQGPDIFNFLKKYKFKHPIQYSNHRPLNETVREDLELKDKDNLINCIIKNSNNQNKYDLLTDKWSSLYSLDRKYLKDNQKLLKCYKYVEIFQYYFHKKLDFHLQFYLHPRYQL